MKEVLLQLGFLFGFVSGERTTFTFWNKGNPGGYFEDCALLDMDRISHWVDYPCTGFLFSVQKHGYICEYNLV